MKRLLYITCSFPPAGGSSVLRALKTIKYLPHFGWEPVVVTTDAPTDIHRDESLEVPSRVRVIRVRSPLASLRRRPRSGDAVGVAGPSRLRRLRALLIRELLVPDSEAPWVLAAVPAIRRELATGSYAAVISTSPLPSGHLAARLALGPRGARRVPWLADVRDPWIERDGRVRAGRSFALVDRMLERFCLSSVDAFVTVNEPLLELYRERLPALERVPCAVVRNGFDPDDFEGPPVALPEDLASLGERCDLVFTGRFYPEVSPEQGLAAALGALGREDPEFAKSVRLFLIGPRDPSFEPDLAAAAPVTVIRRSPLPYREAIAAQRRATALVLLGGLGRFALATSLKVYEYLAAGRPLIAQASRGGELESFLRGRPGVRVAATEDGAAALVPRLRELFAAWRAGTLPPREDAGLADYSRKAQAGAMARLLDGLGRGAAAPS